VDAWWAWWCGGLGGPANIKRWFVRYNWTRWEGSAGHSECSSTSLISMQNHSPWIAPRHLPFELRNRSQSGVLSGPLVTTVLRRDGSALPLLGSMPSTKLHAFEPDLIADVFLLLSVLPLLPLIKIVHATIASYALPPFRSRPGFEIRMSVIPLSKPVYDAPNFRSVKYHPRGKTIHPASLKNPSACQSYINPIPYIRRPFLQDSTLKTWHPIDPDDGPSASRLSFSNTCGRRQPDAILQPAEIPVQPPASPGSLTRFVSFDKEALTKHCRTGQDALEDGGFEEEAGNHTPWQEYEIPNELGLLQPDVPREIWDIILESLNESRAIRLSELHAPSLVGSETIESRCGDAANELVIPESSAMASRKRAVSLGLSAHSPSGDIWIEPTTGLESNSATPRTESQVKHYNVGNAIKNDKRPKAHSEMSVGPSFFKRLRRPKTHRAVSPQNQAQVEGKGKAPLKSSQKPREAIEPEAYECNEQQFPPKCCLLEIPRSLIKRHLLESELVAFDEKALEYSVAIGNRYYCARPECTKWIDTKRVKMHDRALQCPHCSFKMCMLCRGPEHGTGQDCPEDFGLNATLKEAEREGYTCGARWKTCACTEEDQTRRRNEIRENLQRLEAEARAEEAEIRAAIEAVAEAERRAAAAREEEERRQEEERAEEARQIAMRETERVAAIGRHYERLRDAMERVRLHQERTLRLHLETRMQELEQKMVAFCAMAMEEKFAVERASIVDETNQQLLDLQQRHATVLVQTVGRHRKDQDSCLLGLPLDNDSDTAAVLEPLLVAQELEHATLRSMQTAEIKKWRRRGALRLQVFDQEAETRRRECEEERKRLGAAKTAAERETAAGWKWFERVWDRRVAMLEEDEGRMVKKGADPPVAGGLPSV
ncbi:MAG: hypothetical protein Q9214_005179, partial [Letrouitia sp. 1 TL-2023]